jgi:hypothetical protein
MIFEERARGSFNTISCQREPEKPEFSTYIVSFHYLRRQVISHLITPMLLNGIHDMVLILSSRIIRAI